jgi:hypothetical protein
MCKGCPSGDGSAHQAALAKCIRSIVIDDALLTPNGVSQGGKKWRFSYTLNRAGRAPPSPLEMRQDRSGSLREAGEAQLRAEQRCRNQQRLRDSIGKESKFINY